MPVSTDRPTPAVPPPAFTDEQTIAFLDFLTEQGRDRARVIGVEFSEVDYLAGCMAALLAIGRWDKLPGGWGVGPMTGRSVLGADDVKLRAYHDLREAAPQMRAVLAHWACFMQDNYAPDDISWRDETLLALEAAGADPHPRQYRRAHGQVRS